MSPPAFTTAATFPPVTREKKHSSSAVRMKSLSVIDNPSGCPPVRMMTLEIALSSLNIDHIRDIMPLMIFSWSGMGTALKSRIPAEGRIPR